MGSDTNAMGGFGSLSKIWLSVMSTFVCGMSNQETMIQITTPFGAHSYRLGRQRSDGRSKSLNVHHRNPLRRLVETLRWMVQPKAVLIAVKDYLANIDVSEALDFCLKYS